MLAKTLSPKKLAAIVGASESSLKRWIDTGRLVAAKTSGGHRRIAIADAVGFIRQNRLTVVRPDLLGLTLDPEGRADLSEGDRSLLLEKFLLGGKPAEAESLVIAHYLEGASLPEVCDRLIQPALARIGGIWAHDSFGIVLEHRATEICIRTVNLLRSYLPPSTGPLQAVGCAPSGDSYVLPSLCVAACLEGEGMEIANLGSNLPLPLFLQAIDNLRPRFAWLSVSHIGDPEEFGREFKAFCLDLSTRSVPLILGGGESDRVAIPEGGRVFVGQSMSDLTSILGRLGPMRWPQPPPPSHTD